MKVSKKTEREIDQRKEIAEGSKSKPHPDSKNRNTEFPLWSMIKTKGAESVRITKPEFVYQNKRTRKRIVSSLEGEDRNLQRHRAYTRQKSLNNSSPEVLSKGVESSCFVRYKVTDKRRAENNPLGW